MEINAKKQLHYHLVPLLIVSVVLAVASLTFAFHLQNGQMSPNQLLTVRWFTISPTKNGLFEINRASNNTTQQSTVGDLSTAGESAQFQTAIYSK